MGLLDIVFSVLFLILGFNIKNLYSFNHKERQIVNCIFLFHIAVCFAATPILFYGGDANGYWQIPKLLTFNEVWGMIVNNPRPTEVMYLINFFVSNTLGLSFFTGMIFYAVFGMWGFILIMQTVKSFIPNLGSLADIRLLGINIYPFIFLLPNMHFWSVGIGKDTPLFFSVSLFIYSILNIRKRYIGIVIASVISYFLRPHILLFIVSGFALSYMLSQRFPLYQKIIASAVMFIIFMPLLNNTLEFAKIDQFSSEHLENFATSKSKVLSVAGSGVDLSAYPYPLKVVTFLFRPFFFDINGIPAIIASIENLIQVFLLYFFLKNRFTTFISGSNYIIRGCFFYYIIGALAFAPVMSNLGIIIREKNMMMPAFLIFILGSIQFKRLYNNYGK